MPSTRSLILTKLRPPAPRSRTVPRGRLLQKLTSEPCTDLVLVCAPAGYGKTTLLVEWARQLRAEGNAVAWYALDESDNTPSVFGAYLIAGLEQALGPGSGLEPAAQVLRATPEADLSAIFSLVINTLSGADREIWLVLDDYHLVKVPAIHQAVEFLLNHRPENLHLAIGSRSNPPLPLPRLRARGRLIELRLADLRFSGAEAECFLRDSMQLDLPAETSARLAEQVEGWAAGLQLAALQLASLTGREVKEQIAPLSGGRGRLAEYLLEEVVNHLPEGLQSFLLYSSILERMSAPACDAILNSQDSASRLGQLEQLNLFVIALDEVDAHRSSGAGERWFRYHPLFRDFLQTWLTRTQPEQAASLHRAAAGWFAALGSLREAAYHAFRCGDLSFAADFVEQHCFTLIIQSEIATIYEWCLAFPESLLRSRPLLCIFQALALAYRFQGKNRPRVDARLRQAEKALAGIVDPAQAFMVREMAGVVQTFQAMTPNPQPDAGQYLELAEAHLAGFPPGEAGRFPWLLITGYACLALNRPGEARRVLEEALPLALQSGLFFGYVETAFHLARLAHSQGRLADALEICQQSLAEITEIALPPGSTLSAPPLSAPTPGAPSLPASGCLDVAAGCVYLEQDRLDEAEQCLRRGLERMGWGMNPFYLMTAYLAQFHLYEIQGRRAEALACLDLLDALWPDIHILTQGFRVQARLRFHPDDPQAVQAAWDWLQAYPLAVGGDLPLPGTGPIGAAEAYYQANRIWIHLQIALGEPGAVSACLDKQLRSAQENSLPGREIELRLLLAQMLLSQGDEERALAVVGQVLVEAHPAGYIRVFDQGPLLDDLLHRAALKGIYPDNLRRILSAVRSTRRQEAQTMSDAAQAGEVTRPEPFVEGDLIEPLSERELDVLRMIASGATNQAIAERFVITVGTVKSHIHHIFGKLGVQNRTEAVARARKLGLIDIDGAK